MKIKVEDFNDIADEIRNIDRAMVALRQSRLKEEAIIILIQNRTKERRDTIKNALHGLESLKQYIKGGK